MTEIPHPPVISVSFYHPEGGATCRLWAVPLDVAQQIVDELGEPDMTQLITEDQMAATQPIVSNIVTLEGGAS